MRAFNFSPGPAVLPLEVLEQAQRELLDWQHSGMSVMEVSHRSQAFMQAAAEAEADLRELLSVPGNYKVLFMQGGASAQFSLVPMNLAAAAVDGGLCEHRALVACGRLPRRGAIARCTSPAMPAATTCACRRKANCSFSGGAAYVHYTPNETISGVEFGYVPQTGGVPLVADMSSSILSQPIDVSRFGLIYAGAQKNIGPAGLAVVIVREDLHRPRARRDAAGIRLPGDCRQSIHVEHSADFCLVHGGAGVQMAEDDPGAWPRPASATRPRRGRCMPPSTDRGLYKNSVAKDSRSRMNVTFTLNRAGTGCGIFAAGGRGRLAGPRRAIARQAACAPASTMPCLLQASKR